jgi:hypothetical protein
MRKVENRGKPTENGVIRNNLIYKGHGAFVIGSEMSGGARNIFIENCTFIGTDKGLRFKSVRGRGGLVENIYARNIFMRDIVQEAIFFDMYYFVKFATDGVRDMSPVVNDGTPVFRNMQFENIVCNGAQKGVFVRGLPEMPIRNIVMKNMTLSADRGIELTDADQITFDNVQLITKSVNPIIFSDNSTNVSFSGINYGSSDLLISITGERSKNLKIEKTDLTKSKKVAQFEKGAEEKILTVAKGK